LKFDGEIGLFKSITPGLSVRMGAIAILWVTQKNAFYSIDSS
jgi:hypothetical protein